MFLLIPFPLFLRTPQITNPAPILPAVPVRSWPLMQVVPGPILDPVARLVPGPVPSLVSHLFDSETKTFKRFWSGTLPLWLRSLCQPLHEPLSQMLEILLKYKTIFLLAFVSAKRVSEIHSLSYRILHALN